MVPFMAGVLVDLLVRSLQRNHHRPRRGPHRRILERQSVLESVRGHTPEPFNQPQVLGAALQPRLRRVVRCRDDERVALEPAPGVAVPQTQAPVALRTAVERDDPYVVNHLLQDRHVIRRLENLEVAVVPGHQPRHAIGDAALAEAEVFRAGRT